MLGREVKDDAVAGVTQELLARGHRLEDAALAFDPEVAGAAAGLGHQAHHRLRAMDVEVVHDQMPVGLWRACGEQRGQVVGEVLFSAGRAEAVADRSGGHIEIADQGGGAVTDVLELAALGPSRTHRLGGRRALEGLHAGHLIDAPGLDPGGCTLRGELIGLADIVALRREVGVPGGVDPAAGAVGLELQLAQETPHRVGRDGLHDALFARRRGERPLGPMGEGPSARARWLTGQGDELADLLGLEGWRGAWARGVKQPLGEGLPFAATPAFAPTLHGRAPHLQPPGRLTHPDTVAGYQNDLRTQHQTLRRVTLPHNGFKTVAVFRGDMHGGSSAAGHGEQLRTDESQRVQHDAATT